MNSPIPLLLDSTRIEPYLTHVIRHMAESGREGTPLFAPYDPSVPWPADERRKPIVESWSKPLSAAGWERAWAIQDEEKIIAHIDLRPRPMAAARHRVMLGMGVEALYRRKGLGKLLMETVISWARIQDEIDWIDLYAFSHNHAACALYRSMGFLEIGRTPDLFRVAGEKIEDVTMTLRLR